ncbi:unnamed protein product [Miscanthus lutarioriparius]|uniref:Uncharacterized protein n=1 Tax=Miscanthus lutarioriparius TaxID=422564 RepID=A0A811MGT0_9POAL|nr:unnamed protein product [Miscanthus lutarioriparius]
MDQWDDLNTCLLSYFSNAGAVISRLQALGGVPNIREDLMGNHMEVLELIVVNARETLEKFNGIVKALNKALRDTKQMGYTKIINYLLADLEEQASSMVLPFSSSDTAVLRQLFVDQPNIPKDEGAE